MKNLGFPSASNEKKFFYRGKIIKNDPNTQNGVPKNGSVANPCV
jgi:hypothetical protein